MPLRVALALTLFLTTATDVRAQAFGGEMRTAPPVVRMGLRLPEIPLHDPWILADQATRTYYLYSAASARVTGQGRTGTLYYTSKDLATWEGPRIAFVAPESSWADPSVGAWPPEVHAYQGKYWLFTTLHNPKQRLTTTDTTRQNLMRDDRRGERSASGAVHDDEARRADHAT